MTGPPSHSGYHTTAVKGLDPAYTPLTRQVRNIYRQHVLDADIAATNHAPIKQFGEISAKAGKILPPGRNDRFRNSLALSLASSTSGIGQIHRFRQIRVGRNRIYDT
jgi:hypothetical protein